MTWRVRAQGRERNKGKNVIVITKLSSLQFLSFRNWIFLDPSISPFLQLPFLQLIFYFSLCVGKKKNFFSLLPKWNFLLTLLSNFFRPFFLTLFPPARVNSFVGGVISFQSALFIDQRLFESRPSRKDKKRREVKVKEKRLDLIYMKKGWRKKETLGNEKRKKKR